MNPLLDRLDAFGRVERCVRRLLPRSRSARGGAS
jgi:hypothetical protein